MMKKVFLLFLFFSTNLFSQSSDVIHWYDKAVSAQESGNYYQFVLDASSDEVKFKKELVRQLDALKSLSSSERKKAADQIFFYFSSKHQTYKERAMNLLSNSQYSINDIAKARYDSKILASEIIQSVSTYEREVVAFLLFQAEQQLRLQFPKSYIFAIGRDFTKGYLYFKSRGNLDQNNIFTSNISRAVRDEVLDNGKSENLNALLKKLGITAKGVMKNGIVFMDSSMSGKIPRSIIYSLAENLSDTDRYKLLKKCYFLYLNTSRKSRLFANNEQTALRETFSELVERTSNGYQQISSSQLNNIVSYFSAMVPRFQVVIPESHKTWPERHHHNLLEHSFKILKSSIGLQKSSLDIPGLNNHPVEMIEFLVGMLSEIEIIKVAKGHRPESSFNYVKKGIYLKEVFERVQKAASYGFDYMRDWQYIPYPGAYETFDRIKVSSNGRGGYNFKVDGETVLELKRKISEGRNLVVYETMDGKAFKLVKDPKQARKNFMLAWMQEKMQAYKMDIAKVRYIDNSGLWLIQDLVPSETLEYFYYEAYLNNGVKGIPEHIKKLVMEEWKKAYKISKDQDIWLDFKAANYILDTETMRLKNVDYVPRLNNGRKTYFYDKDTGNKLSESEVLNEFFGHDINKGKLKKKPGNRNCYGVFGFIGGI